jgi:hypothetical protein
MKEKYSEGAFVMKELSLHILDIVQNSITAQATLIKVIIDENEVRNLIKISIIDNGMGMGKDLVAKVIDPFTTSRKTRKVGLGIPLFKAAAERCNGQFNIHSELGKGTEVYAQFQRNHIDRAPLGNIIDTMITLIMMNDKIDYVYRYRFNNKDFILDTREIKNNIKDIPLSNMLVVDWIRNFIAEGMEGLTIDSISG